MDFPDDGRAISVTDWDNDGDLDLWITNRTAPRLRLMRNDTKEVNSFISLRLRGNGKTVNKDAIGARVEIINGKLDEDETVYCNQIEIGKILINEEYPFALIKFSNENFNKDLTLKSKNGSFKIFIPEWLKI